MITEVISVGCPCRSQLHDEDFKIQKLSGRKDVNYDELSMVENAFLLKGKSLSQKLLKGKYYLTLLTRMDCKE